ncbi:MAG: CRTAC1 family protein [Bacteroidetes bacterium]|nr:CRTAC1 family protein [Bacteroidota bacterium]
MRKSVVAGLFIGLGFSMLAQGFVNIAPEQNMVYTNPFGQWGSGLSLVDWNQDGWPDVTACRENGPAIVYTQTEGQFLQSELAPFCAGEGKSIQWVDVDNDGDLDLFITQEAAPLIILEQADDGLWIERSSLSNLPLFMPLASCASWSDYDRDGDLDVYLGAYHVDELDELGLPEDSLLWDVWNTGTSEEWPSVTNKMFRNDGDFVFTDVTEATGLSNGIQLTLATLFHDVDLDGWPDLLVANDKWNPNAYYRNQGNGTFEDLSIASNFDFVLDAMTLTEGDINQDGWRDFLITNTPQGTDILLTYNPETAQFEDITNAHFGSLLSESWTWGARFMDYDNDTDLDAFVAEHYPAQPYQLNHFFENGGSENDHLFFIPTTDIFPEDFTNAHSVASADWNRDGRIDFAVHNLGNHKIRMWENVTTNANHWVEIELQGVLSNSQAIGSWVEVHCDHPASPFRSYTALGADYLSQSDLVLHFGLAEVATIDSILVQWPMGLTESWIGLDVDQIHVLVEGESAASNPCPSLDGLCAGCTYADACNYEPEALLDDGSCFFDCYINNSSCGPGTIWDEATSMCIALGFDDCPTDINSDGVTNIADLLWFLTDLSFPCPD